MYCGGFICVVVLKKSNTSEMFAFFGNKKLEIINTKPTNVISTFKTNTYSEIGVSFFEFQLFYSQKIEIKIEKK